MYIRKGYIEDGYSSVSLKIMETIFKMFILRTVITPKYFLEKFRKVAPNLGSKLKGVIFVQIIKLNLFL